MLPSLMVRPLLSPSISRSRCAPSSHSLLNPFLATRASHLRCTENRATSNPQEANVDALDAASSLSPLLVTLTKNTRGGVYLFQPENLFSSFSRLLARHPSLAPKSFTIRTSGKCTPNPIRMCTSKTNDLKLFRMSTSKKTGRGEGLVEQPIVAAVLFLTQFAYLLREQSRRANPPAGYNSAQPSQELASMPPSSSTLPVAQRWRSRLGRAIAADANMRRGYGVRQLCCRSRHPGRRMWLG